jgi:hypothetical protein
VRSCLDDDNGGCPQLCNDIAEDIECSCYEGYDESNNGYTCTRKHIILKLGCYIVTSVLVNTCSNAKCNMYIKYRKINAFSKHTEMAVTTA